MAGAGEPQLVLLQARQNLHIVAEELAAHPPRVRAAGLVAALADVVLCPGGRLNGRRPDDDNGREKSNPSCEHRRLRLLFCLHADANTGPEWGLCLNYHAVKFAWHRCRPAPPRPAVRKRITSCAAPSPPEWSSTPARALLAFRRWRPPDPRAHRRSHSSPR